MLNLKCFQQFYFKPINFVILYIKCGILLECTCVLYMYIYIYIYIYTTRHIM